MKTGIELIAEERERQVSVEGFSSRNDATYRNGELSRAAACYALTTLVDEVYKKQFSFAAILTIWPWDKSWWKPTPENRVRELQKAGALIAAEIDRLQNNIP